MKKIALLLFVCSSLLACKKAKPPHKQKHPARSRVDNLRTFGVNHVGLTVRDVKQTAKFFIEVLKFKKVRERPKYPAIFVSDGHVLITLWQAKTPKPVGFNRKTNIGLHHLALNVRSFSALDKMFARVKKWPGVKIQFAPELLGKGPAKHTMFYEPGGIRLELIHKPSD